LTLEVEISALPRLKEQSELRRCNCNTN
jgi:hypothetical protein